MSLIGPTLNCRSEGAGEFCRRLPTGRAKAEPTSRMRDRDRGGVSSATTKIGEVLRHPLASGASQLAVAGESLAT